MEEIKPCYQKPMDRSIAVALSNCSFCWHAVRNEQKKRKRDSSVRNSGNPKQSEKEVIQPLFNQTVCTLNDINILIPKGRLVGICGTVGAGKSSLLSAILGQMKLEKGTVSVDGSFAYVSQQAWIMNCSLQDNILFGEPFDAKKYYNVIWACALNQDMTTLPAGDQTEIGEKGINLSGGQRQRVALARALYANKDIYFLDDPLSAVDGHVGQHIFEQYIRGALKGKTVFFVTHQLQYLSSCNEVIFMDGGRVIDQGEHATLMNRNELYCTLIQTWLQEKEEVSTIPTNPEIETPIEKTEICSIRRSPVRKMSSSSGAEKNSPEKNNVTKDGDLQSAKQGRLIEEEKVEVGSIPWTTYQIYIQCAGGFLVTFFVMVTFIINIGSTAFSSWWLAHWLNVGVANATRMEGNETIYYKSVRTHPDLEHYQLVYGLFILVILVSSLFRSFFFMKVALRASSLLHNRLFAKIFACPMRFFDSTPVGRILNIFSRDLDETDCRLPSTTEALLQNFLIILVSIIFIVMVLPWFLVALVVLVLVFIFFSRIFRCALRDLKRIENVSRSPIYSHVAATINGLHTVHAFNKEREFISKFMILFDENTSSFFLFNCSMRWLAVRLDFIAVCVMGITAGLVVALHGIIPASMAGLALAYSGQLSGILQYTVRLASETEARFMSVQRMHTYLKTLESEGPAVVEDRRPPDNWPRMGSIRFTNVKMRYRPNLPLVLRNVSFDIEPQEKIGIVGRTGSGKSSLGVCLFRLVEVASGVIKIDGVNILEIGLEDLRSKLSIIPQDPVLFIGSIRYNLDPFNKYSDMAIWEALEQTYMKDKVKLLPAQLESPVVENGENFSVGERQLICMARALLRHSKIILLDEATAAIDAQTDLLVQKTLWKAFKDCTILTIAHRLNTVINCDRILVLEDGKVIEFEKPSILLANCNSVFSGMMKASTSDADGDLLSNAT